METIHTKRSVGVVTLLSNIIKCNNPHIDLLPNDVCCTNFSLISDWSLLLLWSLFFFTVWLTPANNLLVLLWPGADRRGNMHFNGSSVVICLSVTTVMRVYQPAVQQRSIPRCHGNMLREALPSRWSYSGFQASCHNSITLITLTMIHAAPHPRRK
jgi:hypothetical protein